LREKQFCCSYINKGLANNTGKINPLKSRDKMRLEKLPGLKLILHRESDKEPLISHLTG